MIENKCDWLHEILSSLQIFKYPFDVSILPHNGLYFFYEEGEVCQNNANSPRIVRIGTARNGNFQSRISEHFLLDERKMNFENNNPKPSDRSIFRKNIGRALLNKENNYLEIWNIDFTIASNRVQYQHLRNIKIERMIENRITDILRNTFSFRFLSYQDSENTKGQFLLEEHLIGTVSRCSNCFLSQNWLGKYSPDNRIRESGLWQVQHLDADAINEREVKWIIDNVTQTINMSNY